MYCKTCVSPTNCTLLFFILSVLIDSFLVFKWKSDMAINDLGKGRYSHVGYDYFVTFNTNRRIPFLTNENFAKIVAQTIHYHEGIHLMAWVIMPDHVHMLFTLEKGNLSKVIQSVKANSSRKIRLVHGTFRWARGFYDHGLRAEEARVDIARYIIANPLRARLVEKLVDYPWWNAIYL